MSDLVEHLAPHAKVSNMERMTSAASELHMPCKCSMYEARHLHRLDCAE